MSTTTTPNSWSWTCTFQWIIANTVGWALAMLLGVLLGDGKALWLVGGGGLIGIAEWLALSRRLPISVWWAAGFGLGWSISLWAGWHFGFFAPNVLWLGCTGGGLVGIQQWLALRAHVGRAVIWLPIFIASSFIGTWAGEAAGWAYYNLTSNQAMAYVLGGGCAGDDRTAVECAAGQAPAHVSLTAVIPLGLAAQVACSPNECHRGSVCPPLQQTPE
jgi:hypothetical protein